MEFGLLPAEQKSQEEGKEESSKLAEKQKTRVIPSHNIHINPYYYRFVILYFVLNDPRVRLSTLHILSFF